MFLPHLSPPVLDIVRSVKEAVYVQLNMVRYHEKVR